MPGTTTYYPVSQEANAGTLTPEPMVKATVPRSGRITVSSQLSTSTFSTINTLTTVHESGWNRPHA